VEEGALWLPESDPHDLAAQKRNEEKQKHDHDDFWGEAASGGGEEASAWSQLAGLGLRRRQSVA